MDAKGARVLTERLAEAARLRAARTDGAPAQGELRRDEPERADAPADERAA